MFRPKRLGAFVSFESLEDRTMLAAVTVDNDLDVVNGTTTSIAALIASDGGDGISLREAIIAANNDGGADTIDFDASLAGGTITLGGTQLTITDDLTITGLGADQLTIDGNNASRIFNVDDGTLADIDVEIVGLTLTGGNGSGGHGGAIANTENLTVANSTISGNDAFDLGGGIFNHNHGILAIVESVISGNDASYGGGGIFSYGGILAIVDSVISGNDAILGGGIVIQDWFTEPAELTVVNTTISGNTADERGGGIVNFAGNMMIANSTITGNTITGNTGINQAGGILSSRSIASTILNSTISGNSTGSSGNGGGISHLGGILTSINNTITNNTAGAEGGGVFLRSSSATTAYFSNSIISGNSAVGDGAEVDIEAAVTFNSNSNLFGHSGLANADALDGVAPHASDITATSDGTDPTALAGILTTTLAFNGGPTLTHALVVGSPAINAGDNANLPADVLDLDGDLNVAEALPVDQRGAPFVRTFGGTVDIGAYEVQPRTLVVDTLVDESDGDFSAGDLSLREAIEWANANAGADAITFDDSLSGGTITLGGTELTITDSVTIVGLGADQLTIDADGASRIFTVDDGTGSEIDVEIVALTLTGGNAGAEDVGGAIFNRENLTVANSTISGNSTDFTGGGIGNYGTLTVTNSTISGNSSGNAGGGIYSYGTLNVANSTISGNSAYYGGGIFNWYGTLTVTNSTITGNSTTNTGGGLSNYGTTTITNSTISGNAATNGGGIYNSGTVTVANTITSGNSAGTGAEFRNFGTFNADANNLFGHSGLTNADAFTGFTPGASDITATSDGTDPTALAGILNTSLAFNGGPTRTHALVVGSPAINAGDNTHAFGLTSDQRGTPFVRAFGTVDIGAYEMQPRTLVVDTLVDESDGDFSAGDLSLREAIEWANANAGADTITFDADLAGGTITLGGTQITISDDLTITGLGADQLTIDADGLSRIFNIDDGTGTAIDVEIVGLTLTGGDPGGSNDGGAILNQESLAIAESVISGNAAYLGGGIYNYGILAIVDSVISGNEALQGGGISQYGSYAELTVVNTTISGNTADELGGGIVNFSGKMTIANSTIADNLGVSYGGGGIFNFNHDPSHTTTILNSTITGNSTGAAGGGIYHNGGILTSINNTITNNTAGYFGGGVALLDDGFTATTANLSNNIISGNSTVGDGTEVYNDAAVTFNSNSNLFGHSGLANADALDGVAPHASDITATSDGTDPTALAGILNPTLAFNGGSTRTHALVVGSPAINAGNNANLPADTLDLDGDGNVVEALPVDQRGVPFTRTSGTVDIGAFELQPGVVFDGTNGDDEITVSLAGAMFVVTVNGVDHEVDPADIDHIEVRGLAGNDTLHIIGTPGVDNTTLHPGTVELVGTGITLVGDSFEAIDVASGGGQDRANLWDSVSDDEYVATPTSATLQGPGFINRVDDYRRAYAYSYAGGFDTVEFFDSAGNDNFVGEEARSWLTNAGVATYYNSASRFDRVSAYASTGYDVAMMWDSADDDAFEVEPSLGSLSGGGFNNRAHDFNRVYAYSYVGGVDEAHFYDSSGDDRFIGKDIRSTIQNTDITYYGSASRFEEVYAYAVNGGNDRADLHGNANSDTLVSGVDTTTMSASNYFYEVTGFETVNATAGAGGTDVADLADSAGDDWFLDIPASSYVVWGNNNRISLFNFNEVDFESLLGGNDTVEYWDLDTLDEIFGLDDLVEVTRNNGRVVQAAGASLAEVIAESLAAPGPITNLTSLDYIFTQSGVWS